MIERLGEYRRKARAFLRKGVWEMRPRRLPRLHAAGLRLLRVLLITGRGFRENRCRLHASALTFVTLLAVVPVLAMMFAIARGFSAAEYLESFFGRLIQQITEDAATRQQLTELSQSIIRTAKEADPATLGAIGVALFLYSLVKMLGTIEGSFNAIWGVSVSRPFLRKVADYLSIIVVMSVLFGAPALATGSMASNWVVQFLEARGLLSVRLLVFLAPWVGFALLNVFIPNTKVHWRPAIAGGVLGGALWNLSIVVFVKAGMGLASRNAVYGTFATIPFALVWLQLNWLIILLSAQLTYAFQNERAYVREGAWIEASHANREALALAVMAPIAQRFNTGKAAWTADALAEYLDAPLRLVNELLELLRRKRILVPSTAGENTAFVPARSLEAIPVSAILDAVGGYDEEQSPTSSPGSAVLDVQRRVREAAHGAVTDLTAADLARLCAPEPAAPE